MRTSRNPKPLLASLMILMVMAGVTAFAEEAVGAKPGYAQKKETSGPAAAAAKPAAGKSASSRVKNRPNVKDTPKVYPRRGAAAHPKVSDRPAVKRP